MKRMRITAPCIVDGKPVDEIGRIVDVSEEGEQNRLRFFGQAVDVIEEEETTADADDRQDTAEPTKGRVKKTTKEK